MKYLDLIQEKKPLIHHLTNWVTIYDCAQVTRSLGALPVMAHAKEEVPEMVMLASALVLNIGTLTKDFVEAQILAGKAANKKGIPVVLDIVGCGATKMRSEASEQILREVKVSLIKGNYGEISVLAGHDAEVRGVESIGGSDKIDEAVMSLAKSHNAIVVATGKVDIIGDSEKVLKCEEGHEMMGKVVGTGCMAASVLGSFLSVCDKNEHLDAAFSAMMYYGKCGERAASKSEGAMEFKMRFLDEIGI